MLAAEPPVSGHSIRLVAARLGGDAVAISAASRAREGLCVTAAAGR